MPVSVRPTTIQPITLRELQVLRVEDVTPTMRRLVLGGDQLEAFERDGFELPEFVSLGFDDHVKIFFPDPVTGTHVLPTQLERRIEWSDDPAPIARSYTVRSFDGTEVAIDVVVHSAGVATAWALACAPGDPIWLAGPKMGMLLPESTDWLLLAGDETALPAIARCLEELPAGMPAQVIVEVDGPESEQDLQAPDGAEIRWLHRGGAEPGTTTLLEDAIREADWWPGEAFAWVAGETMTLRPIRALLREERGMPRERLDIAAYWRRREHDPSDLLENGMRPDALEELGDLLAPYAIRAAVTLGIGEALADGPAPLDRLAAASGADPAALGRLLRYLAVRGLVEGDPAGYALSAQGAALAGEDADAYDLRLPLARLELTAARLLDAVRTGRAQADVDALRAADPGLDAAFADHAREELAFAAPLSARRSRSRPARRSCAVATACSSSSTPRSGRASPLRSRCSRARASTTTPGRRRTRCSSQGFSNDAPTRTSRAFWVVRAPPCGPEDGSSSSPRCSTRRTSTNTTPRRTSCCCACTAPARGRARTGARCSRPRDST